MFRYKQIHKNEKRAPGCTLIAMTVIAGAVIPFRGEMTQPDYRISDTFPYEVFGDYPII